MVFLEKASFLKWLIGGNAKEASSIPVLPPPFIWRHIHVSFKQHEAQMASSLSDASNLGVA